MNEYYGSNLASSDFFAHYGVKGMKWGVRKALKKTGEARNKAISRQYKKATKKLEKLSERANPELQMKKAKKYTKATVGALGVGLGGIGAAAIGKNKKSVALNSIKEADKLRE